MGNSASLPGDPSLKLRVISAGYSRTGSASMTLALERILGAPVTHGGSQMIHGNDALAELCDKILTPAPKEVQLKRLRKLTEGYAGITDGPGYCFVPELMEIYPDAKVILTKRDPASWQRSMKTMVDMLSPPWVKWFLLPCPKYRWLPSIAKKVAIKEAENCPAFSNSTDYLSQDILCQHNDWIRRVVPKDKLLEYRLGDGWSPLCSFLGVPVPNEPFPHINDSENVQNIAKMILWDAGMRWIGILSCIGLLAALLARHAIRM